MHAHHAQNLFVLRSLQLFLNPEREIRAGMDLYTDDTRASRLQGKGRRFYLSQSIGPAVAGSARHAPPPLMCKTATPQKESNYYY